jgi:hypothetical protein
MSFIHRLALTNDFPVLRLLRVVGDCTPLRSHLLGDAHLNPAAAGRLAVLSRTPLEHLIRALPGLTPPADVVLAPDRPVLRFTRKWPYPVPACQRCTLLHGLATRHAGQHRPEHEHVCMTHRRWIGRGGPQHDLTPTPEILRAQNTYNQVAALTPPTFRDQHTVEQTTLYWVRQNQHHDVLRKWADRAEKLGTTQPAIVRFPEVVGMLQVIADPSWRSQVAQCTHPWQLRAFYAELSDRTGTPFKIYDRIPANDPIATWAATLQHHYKREQTRLRREKNLDYLRNLYRPSAYKIRHTY